MSKKIYFGQSLIEVLEKLGNPNKEYVKNDKQFLNYLELGIDILIDNVDNSVKKLILHTNYPQMPNFCFYERCFF